MNQEPTEATSHRARTALILGGLVVAFLVCEVTVRIVVRSPPQPRRTEPEAFSPFRDTPKGLYVYRPGVTFSHFYDPLFDERGYFGESGRIDYRLNNLGFRGDDFPLAKPEGSRRILCLGDSFTFGEGVRQADTWPEQLAKELGGETQVINAGVQGYDLDHESLYLLLYGRQLQPDVVVIGFFINDLMPFGETVARHEAQTERKVHLSLLGRASALWGFFEQRRVAARRQRAYIRELRDSFDSEAWRQAVERIKKLRELADHDDFALVAMIFPLLYELNGDYPLLEEHREVREAFEDASVPVLDLLDAYRGREARELWVHPVDPHPNEVAHQVAAKRIAEFLRELAPRLVPGEN